MSLSVDVFWSFRSPYSYLATPQMVELTKRYDVDFNIRPVYPLAVRVDNWFKDVNPMWLPYLFRDVLREAERHEIPFGPPRPDPIVMNMGTGDVPKEQPYIHRLTRLGVLASERGRGLPFISEVATLIWSGRTENWDQGDHMAKATSRAGLDLRELDDVAVKEAKRLESAIEANQQAHKVAGHWGVPTFAFEGEPFFGQDRIPALVWRLKKKGLKDR
jgi:2-hydroxychromene-2-carboxylate isomerase